jgi:hypothetical protein
MPCMERLVNRRNIGTMTKPPLTPGRSSSRTIAAILSFLVGVDGYRVPLRISVSVVPMLWAAIGSIAVFQLEILQDLGLSVAGLVGLVAAILSPARADRMLPAHAPPATRKYASKRVKRVLRREVGVCSSLDSRDMEKSVCTDSTSSSICRSTRQFKR